MAFSGIAEISHVVDILYYTVIDDCWEVGDSHLNKFIRTKSLNMVKFGDV
jgi:hypothetical protein